VGDASVMRNLTSPKKLVECVRAAGVVPDGAVKVVPVWEEHAILVIPNDERAGGRELDAMVSRLLYGRCVPSVLIVSDCAE